MQSSKCAHLHSAVQCMAMASAAAACMHGNREADDGVCVTIYDSTDEFERVACRILQADPLRNTLCLTHLNSLSTAAGHSSTLAVLVCNACDVSVALVTAPSAGATQCYVSAEICPHHAARLAQLLTQQLQHCNRVTVTSRAAGLIATVQSHAERWSEAYSLQLMRYDRNQCSTGCASYPCTCTDVNASNSGARGADAAAACGAATAAGYQQQQRRRRQRRNLNLQKCMGDSDVTRMWVLSMSAAFLQEVFDAPEQPPLDQVAASVVPRMHQGWLYCLYECEGQHSRGPVCLVAHHPSGNRSTRITMVYTPPEHRGHGYATAAVRQMVQLLLQDYSSICLFADKAKPHMVPFYQKLGFVYVEDMSMLSRPAASQGQPDDLQAQGA